MPLISFQKDHPPLFCEVHDNLMATLRKNQVPVASSCQGDGICGKCRIQVISGSQNLSSPNEREKILAERENLKGYERISCQTEVIGDVMIDAPYW